MRTQPPPTLTGWPNAELHAGTRAALSTRVKIPSAGRPRHSSTGWPVPPPTRPRSSRRLRMFPQTTRSIRRSRGCTRRVLPPAGRMARSARMRPPPVRPWPRSSTVPQAPPPTRPRRKAPLRMCPPVRVSTGRSPGRMRRRYLRRRLPCSNLPPRCGVRLRQR